MMDGRIERQTKEQRVDGSRFDVIARSLATSGSRRGVVRRGAIAVLGAVVAGFGLRQPAGAACRGGGQTCRRNGQCCSGTCRANGTCKPAGVGQPCDAGQPSDCRSGVCGCTARNTAGKLVNCTCRRGTCPEAAETGCAETADCCEGRCLASRGVCLPPAQQCIPEGASCEEAPTLCCPGFSCTGGVCTD